MAMSRSLGATSLTTRVPMRMVPAVASSSPASIRSAVDLPEPDGPTRTISSPSPTSRSKSLHRLGAVGEDLGDALEGELSHQLPPAARTRAMKSRYHSALRLGTRAWVAKSTWTMPKRLS